MQTGVANDFPYGQCTWWADNRFHEATGIYVPMTGNANAWSQQARAAGWTVTTNPVSGPQILCLQAFVEGAGMLGHVAYVEQVMDSHTVNASSMNWTAPGVSPSQVSNWTFSTAMGVSFISLPGGATPLDNTPGNRQKIIQPGTSGATTNLSGLSQALSQLAPLGEWFKDPVRIAKLVMGFSLLIVALFLLFLPSALKVGKAVAKVGVLL